MVSPAEALAQSRSGQPSKADAPSLFDRGYLAWNAGDYLNAIDAFEEVLEVDGSEGFLREIALVSGEWFHTTEIAPDGTSPAWSPDGNYFSFSVSTGGTQTIRVFQVGDGVARHTFDVEGSSLAFAPDGKSASFLRLTAGSEYEAARETASANIQVRSRADFMKRREALAKVDALFTTIVARDLATGTERTLDTGGLPVFWVGHRPSTNQVLAVLGGTTPGSPYTLEVFTASGSREIVATASRFVSVPQVGSDGRLLVYEDPDGVKVVEPGTGSVRAFEGSSPMISRDGSTIVFSRTSAGQTQVLSVRSGGDPVVAFTTEHPLENVAVSPSGSRIAFQLMERENWEIFVVAADGSSSERLTHEIQHDLFPQFLDDATLFAVIGEGRHRRSYMYDVSTGERTRLFHNNTIRTVAPEYEWAISPDGTRIVTVSERDGDTISPERGVYLTDLNRTVSIDEIRERLALSRVNEQALREMGERLFGPIRADVAKIVARISTGRIYGYESDLFAFGSKHITQPGNAKAIEYIEAALRSFGYEPELQWFEPRPGVRTANIIATLPGTVDPQLHYVVSSHFDSVERGPGADDNTSGTTALLEAARVMRNSPQDATIRFAFFTGEEAGLLGSREFVRRAVAAGDKIVGALNNDMVGFANDDRLDNTIRYSNDGIRDIQHNAARMFSNLITYDARYYKSTDAHAYYEAYGDIVGGIGSYPILGNPHYHQTHDVLETINHQLVAEVSKTTVATLALLASSPSRLGGIRAVRDGSSTAVSWDAGAESSIRGYVVNYESQRRGAQVIETTAPRVTLTDAKPGTEVEVRAVNAGGLVSWDAARVTVQ